ncbi:hypothetical protein [Nocardiopsis kunsanensis]|uniref:hypothetical protein n=1 Tax=Nocardiopsis kunsanensis TaxID=141693 RepID=UPI00034B726B|nr:hypothetical protein [Nocardiopsis kunsanensis]
MRQWASTSAKSLLLAAGFVALGSGVAFADSGAATSGNGSAIGGNQIVANADVPVNIAGNAVSALGVSGANATETEAEVEDHGDNDVRSSGNGSLLGGNQAVIDGDVPVNIDGNAVGVLGVAGANATDAEAEVEHQSAPSEVTATDVLGEAAENAQLLPAADTSGVDAGVLRQSAPGGHGHDSVATSGNGSLLGGNQAVIDGDVPVNIAGNAVGVLGVAGANATDAEAEVEHHHQDVRSSGNGSLLGGNQLVGDLDVPVNVTGNGIGVLGVAGANATDAEAEVEHQSASEQQTALESLPVVEQLPEVPVSEQLPVAYDLQETEAQSAEEAPAENVVAQEAPVDPAPEAPAEESPAPAAPAEEAPSDDSTGLLPEASEGGLGSPVDDVLGAVGLGL